MATDTELGEIVIAPEVLEVIIGIAASKVDGVHSLRNKRNLTGVNKRSEGRGVYVENIDGKVVADLYVYLTAGIKVPKVASDIQREVKGVVSRMTDVVIDEVNIHVLEILPSSEEKPEFDDLFKEGFFDVE
ncbi:MAG: Asp23/Gls24 family envelope stress response protein [Streptococcaceae bacterium]|nr:Asp23/Gls24 family envelope stress response protein [Streptococcaceae bacterium]